MNNKKGISEVITTVLIVLLSVIAVAILWGFLSPLITKSGQKAQASEACFNLDIVPTVCTYTTVTDPDTLVKTYVPKVIVKRGSNTASVSALKGVLYLTDGTSVVSNEVDKASLPGELGTVTLTFASVSQVPVGVTAAGSIDVSGSSSYCPESEKITCTAA